MKIHEHQAKEILARYGVAVPAGKVAFSPPEAASAYEALDGGTCAVKAQIHAGGRGKAGGIKLVRSAAEAAAAAEGMLGKPLVTAQTGPGGRVVRRILVEKGCSIAAELYVGMALDRRLARPVAMACAEGGVEIEEVAARAPEKIRREAVSPTGGLRPYQARSLAFGMDLSGKEAGKVASLIEALARAYLDLDLSIAEVNPLVLTKEGEALALDAKVVFDGNGLYRHPEAAKLRDLDEEDPKEVEASRHDLSYVALDGSIGCMVNGAGLAMATMDALLLHGGKPANFLDVGGGATKERVAAAFKILLSDPRVRAVLVNIFGGIVKCDVLAEGVVAAAREVGLKVPLVVRLEGTNVEKGREILRASGLPIAPAAGMDEAAALACAAARGRTG
ncbi:MAG TPA: ADP-forming succinate--CoA ligase subunit beta [Planctomycetota bacterium]|nr:ADP-forming succinate--CoA ligase subunit beta [Planctomycetota bacterium]